MISLDALYADLQNKDNQNPSCGDGDLPPNNMSGYPVCLAKNCEGGGVKAALGILRRHVHISQYCDPEIIFSHRDCSELE
jgi:hypothetical protein